MGKTEFILFVLLILSTPVIFMLYRESRRKASREDVSNNLMLFLPFYALVAALLIAAG
jgi:cbb3-type cytochrome oxidase subunit 3